MSSDTHPARRRCLVVAEVAQAHDGSYGLAHAFIDAVARAGADAVKFQTHIAAAESTPAEPWRARLPGQTGSRYDYWRRMEFTESQWRGLRDHAVDCGLQFVSSPFSIEAVRLLEAMGMPFWKIPSGEVANESLLDAVLTTGRPVVLSSGMSTLAELDAAVERLRRAGVDLTVLQCTSMYPCPPEKVGIQFLDVFRQRYRCSVGLSDHSGTIFPALASATLGAAMVEVHVTLSREMFGPDVPVSVTTSELKQISEGVRFIERMIDAAPDKDAIAHDLAPIREIFTKSIVAARTLRSGTVLHRDDLAAKKPGTGIPAGDLPRLVGSTLLRDVTHDELLTWSDVAPRDTGSK